MDSQRIHATLSLAIVLSTTFNLAQNTVHRNETYTIGRSVNLTCTNKTWTEMFYTTWNIYRNGNHCIIAASTERPPHDTCLDGKVMRNTTNQESYLHIPIFKDTDEGIYKCETAFRGANHIAEITVSALVSPQTPTRLDIYRNEFKWFWIIIPLGSISFIAATLTGFYIARKHLNIKQRNSWKSNIPAPPPKTQQGQDVGEVEPYASYVQRNNPIYSSVAELLDA